MVTFLDTTLLPNFSWFLYNLFKIRKQHLFSFLAIFTISVGSIKGMPLNLNQWIIIFWFIYQCLFIRVKMNINYYISISILLFISTIFHSQYFSWEMIRKFLE